MRINVQTKIGVSFILMIVLGGSIWLASDYTHHLLYHKVNSIYEKYNLFNMVLEIRRYEKNYFLYADPTNIDEAVNYIDKAQQKLLQIIKEYPRYTDVSKLQQTLKDLRDYKSLIIRYKTLRHGLDSSSDNNRFSKFLERDRNQIRASGKKITEALESLVFQQSRNINQIISTSRAYLLIASFFAFILALMVALFLVFNVNRPLRSIARGIRKISRGDYTHIPQLGTNDEFDELAGSMNKMIDELEKRREQLIQSEKMASLGTLTAGVAHELNNPLNNISTSIQIVHEELDEKGADRLSGMLAEAEKQVERARDIVKSLLEYSRESNFRVEPFYFRALVEKTMPLLRGEIPKNIDVRIEIPDDIVVNLDFKRIQQVLINLIKNAVQAMPEGGGVVISAQRDSKDEFSFTVRDTGLGIPEADQHKIFDPFFTTKEVGKGSGLGLSVSLGIIKNHGGRIEVDSTLGNGTAFTVFLPAN